jgi:phosphatidylglycerol:prolipoprotein diacylglycerol transferase
MLKYPAIDPEIFRIGFVSVRWYGVMYIIGYILGYQLLKRQIRKGLLKVSMDAGENLMTSLIVGMLIGARLVYVVVYNWEQFVQDPSEIYKVWNGGLSFHGAAIGMIVVCALFARKHKVPFYSVTDALAFGASPGLFFGRMGNFINGELWGRPSDVSWAMVFPRDPLGLARHPSQLYQGLTEGVLLFLFLYLQQKWMLKNGRYRVGITGASFLIGYGAQRFLTEYAREPDAQLGFVLGHLSMGQVLCLIMFFSGLVILRHVMTTQTIQNTKA